MSAERLFPRRRACLAVPGSSERMLAKAAASNADEVVIDLEDAVAPAAKTAAREQAVAALRSHAWLPPTPGVRVNAPRSPWCHLDVAALAVLPDRPVSIIVPKVEGPGDLAFVERLLDGVERAAGRRVPMRVQALVETAAGLAAVHEIAASCERLDALVLGYADLGASLGRSARGAADLDAWRSAQDGILVAARAHGLQAIDGPFLGIGVDERFLAAATRARDLGFDGKWAIHPGQIATLTELFTPTEEELAQARAIVAALTHAERNSARGAVALDGQMLDEAVRVGAQRILARAGQRGSVQ